MMIISGMTTIQRASRRKKAMTRKGKRKIDFMGVVKVGKRKRGGDESPPRLSSSDGADGRPGLDVHDPDASVGLGQVRLVPLHDGVAERPGNGSHGGTVRCVDDLCVRSFDFYCV
jgi:hypothetical protein